MGIRFEVVEELECILGIGELASDVEYGARRDSGEESAEFRVGGPGMGIGGLEEGQRLGNGVWWWQRLWGGVEIAGEATKSGGGVRS